MSLSRLVLALILSAALTACGEEQEAAGPPAPQEPSREAVGYYCGMMVVEHAGPKGQIFLEDRAEPIWFSSVRDTLAFTMLPEEPKTLAAVYVNDMAKVGNWDRPEPGLWVDAKDAHFVVGSDARGGMGAPEAVPFSDRAAAERFQSEHGGAIYRFEEIPERFVLGPDDDPNGAMGAGPDPQLSDGAMGEAAGHSSHGAPDND